MPVIVEVVLVAFLLFLTWRRVRRRWPSKRPPRTRVGRALTPPPYLPRRGDRPPRRLGPIVEATIPEEVDRGIKQLTAMLARQPGGLIGRHGHIASSIKDPGDDDSGKR